MARLQKMFTKPSRTKQSFRDECDINTIMKRYEKTGLVTHVKQYGGRYEDVTGSVDYQTAVNAVIAADSMFMTLPASIRTRFGNDPAAFLSFVSDAKNVDEMVSLGILDKKPVVEKPDDFNPVSDKAAAK